VSPDDEVSLAWLDEDGWLTARDREFHFVREGPALIPDLTYAERTAADDEALAWEPSDFDPSEFVASPVQRRERDETPANWELDLNKTLCINNCGRSKAPKRRYCFACIKRQQRNRDAMLNRRHRI